MRHGAVDLPVPAEVAHAYLVDPANRAQWQSSLRAVEVDGAVVRPARAGASGAVVGRRHLARAATPDAAHG